MVFLQGEVKKVQEARGEKFQEVVLHLDIKIRWNSMLTMLESFFKVKFFKICQIFGIFNKLLKSGYIPVWFIRDFPTPLPPPLL